MNIKNVAIIAGSAFVVIVILAIGVSTKFSLSNIVADPYAFIEKFFTQWSLALSAAGTLILALSVFSFIYENRRREEKVKQQAIHALHEEIHWNLRPVITLRFDISERIRHMEEHSTIPAGSKAPYQTLETRVFDDMRSHGQLHWLEELRMDIIFCYSLIDIYNREKGFKPKHLKLLTTLHERLMKVIKSLEAKFKFLPRYIRYEEETIQIKNEHDSSTN